MNARPNFQERRRSPRFTRSAAHRNNQSRAGVAAVEFAVMLPLLVMLIVGSLEAARAVTVSHTLQQTSQAACRVYSVGGTSIEDAVAVIDAAMANARITNYQTTFSPDQKKDIDKTLKEVTVTISVPYNEIRWLPPFFMTNAVLEGRTLFPADLEVSDGGDIDGYSITDDDHTGDGYLRYDDDNDD